MINKNINNYYKCGNIIKEIICLSIQEHRAMKKGHLIYLGLIQKLSIN